MDNATTTDVAANDDEPRQRQQNSDDILKNLLRTLRQSNHEEEELLKRNLNELINNNSGSFMNVIIQTYQSLLDQAIRTIPPAPYAPHHGDDDTNTGFFSETTTTVTRADGESSIALPSTTNDVVDDSPPPTTLSVHEVLIQTLREGIFPPLIPPILLYHRQQYTTKSDSGEEDTIQVLLSKYLLLFAAYRLPDGIREVFSQIDETTSSGMALDNIIDYSSDDHGTALRLAARVGGKNCVELLLSRDANPNKLFSPCFGQYTALSVVQSVLQVLQIKSVPPAEAKGHVEAVDFLGVLDSLLMYGAEVNETEAQAAMQVADTSALQKVLKAGRQQGRLSKDVLTELAPTAIYMDSKEGPVEISRLDLLLENGLDASKPLSDLSVPWVLGKKSPTLIEIAIQLNDVNGFQSLRNAGGSVLGVLDRVLCTLMTEEIMVAIEEAIEEERSNNNLSHDYVLRPPTFSIQTGLAWVGNVPDFETYLRRKTQPLKLPKLDPQLEAVLKAQADKQKNNTFPDMPAKNGDWAGLTPLPTLQIAFHVDCPDDYLIGAVVGAIYGGFKEGEWNPLCPPESDLIFTGRMAYSEEDPRHVTWFMDAMAIDRTEATQEETQKLNALREADVPDGTVLERLRSLALVGLWKNNSSHSATLKNFSIACMWTCQQEYRYGIMAGSQVFVSVGYEAMDLNVETIASVLDCVIRAKQQYHKQPGDTQNSFFERTPFSSIHAGHLEKVPKKRTPTEIFESQLAHGEKFTGIDPRMWGQSMPPKKDLKRFSPEHQIFDVIAINTMLKHKFECSMAKQLEEDTTLLIDELVMMFLHDEIVPALTEALRQSQTTANINDLSSRVAEKIFPGHDRQNTIDFHCFRRLVPVSESNEDQLHSDSTANREDSGLSSVQATALKDCIGAFLVSQSSDLQPSSLEAHSILTRVYDVCLYLVLETLELANNDRRGSDVPSILPRNIRWSVFLDNELLKIFHMNEAMEFFYPLRH